MGKNERGQPDSSGLIAPAAYLGEAVSGLTGSQPLNPCFERRMSPVWIGATSGALRPVTGATGKPTTAASLLLSRRLQALRDRIVPAKASLAGPVAAVVREPGPGKAGGSKGTRAGLKVVAAPRTPEPDRLQSVRGAWAAQTRHRRPRARPHRRVRAAGASAGHAGLQCFATARVWLKAGRGRANQLPVEGNVVGTMHVGGFNKAVEKVEGLAPG